MKTSIISEKQKALQEALLKTGFSSFYEVNSDDVILDLIQIFEVYWSRLMRSREISDHERKVEFLISQVRASAYILKHQVACSPSGAPITKQSRENLGLHIKNLENYLKSCLG